MNRMDAINLSEQTVGGFLFGDMGVQLIYVGDSELYKRESSYCYIKLESEE